MTNPLIDSLMAYLPVLHGQKFSITGSDNLVKITVPDGQVMIHPNGEIMEHRRDGVIAAVRPEIMESSEEETETQGSIVPAAKSKFTKADYDTLLERMQLSYKFTLDCEAPFEANEDDSYPNHIYLGALGYNVPGEIPGLLSNQALWDKLGGYEAVEKWKRNCFRSFKQEDGEIGMEIRYFPNMPFDEEERRLIYERTRLSEIISWEDFCFELEQEFQWTEDLFGHNDIYDLVFEVVPAGHKPKGGDEELDIYPGEALLEKPLWIQRDGKKYNIHIWEHED